ncbi:MAG: sulfotransferase family protein [Pirellulaceae bacterium]|nr:MAG: sulfotransferase family protein [Pirellulaceae bacterium]
MTDQETGRPKVRRNPFPAYAPRFWHGMRFGPWWRLLARNRFRVHPLRSGLACTVTGCSVLNSLMAARQRMTYGRLLAEVALDQPPLFVIGHWRSGTTFLHELLALDPQFTYPTTYECFAAEHFLVSRPYLAPLVRRLLPRKRPMDDVAMGLDRPQEDEIALCSMGAPSPMLRLAFPNHEPPDLEMLDFAGVAAPKRRTWEDAWLGFLRTIVFCRPGKRLILKSPTHTGRIGYLLKLFPQAQFVHIARDPYALYGSTLRLWRTLDEDHGLQIPHHRHLEAFVFSACRTMYTGYLRDRSQLGAAQLCEVRYEELVVDPLRQLHRIYEALELEGWDRVEPRVRAYLQERRDYRPADYRWEPHVLRTVRQQWDFYFDAFGYDAPSVAHT